MVLLIASILCFAAGIWLIKRGYWPSRIGDTPHCPACNYILTGIQVERCPECGRMLWPGNIVSGEQRRRPRPILAGIILILVPIALLIIQTTAVLQDVNWYQYRPTAWVMNDLDGSSSGLKDKAWAELQRRLSGGSLSAAQQNALVERALREQQTGGGANGYSQAMTDFLAARYLDQKLSAGQADAFFANAMKLQLEIRSLVGRGDPVPFRISSVGHGPLGGWWMRASQQGYWVDEKKFDRGTSSSTAGFNGWSSTSSLDPQPPGKHRLRIEVDVGAGTGDIGNVSGPLDHPRTIALTADFQVVPDELSVQWTASPSAAAIEKSLSVSNFALSSDSAHSLSGSIEATNPPVNLAFEAFAAVNGKEYSLGKVNFHQSATANSVSSYYVSTQFPVPGNPRQIDIILRSSERTAKETVDFTTAWKGEIVIHNVPVQQSPATSPGPAK